MLGFDMSFGIFSLLFGIVFILIIVVFVVTFVRILSQWGKNNRSPRLTVEATVVAKRTNVSHSHHNTGSTDMDMTTTSTTYYATFQVESGDRMELSMSGSEYGMLIEGDHGKLTFQGTRYLGFQRI